MAPLNSASVMKELKRLTQIAKRPAGLVNWPSKVRGIGRQAIAQLLAERIRSNAGHKAANSVADRARVCERTPSACPPR